MKLTVMHVSGIAVALVLLPCTVLAFDSGSSGADGDFNPPVSVEVPLPTSGILNYRSVNIPLGVTVRFKRNAINTPVTILVAGDAVISGSINLDGETAPDTGPIPGNDNPLDDGLLGKGGPGGFDGGYGGLPADSMITGGSGLGPGGGGGGLTQFGMGGGAGYATVGTTGRPGYVGSIGGAAGTTYGSSTLLPLIGGSGGGGGGSEDSYQGSGGGGGGGAMLLAATGTVAVTGRITANGGGGGNSRISDGGGGSGGGIRIVATTITGRGTISADGGPGSRKYKNGPGGQGRIRLEAENMVGIGATSPAFSFGTPGPLFVTGRPALRFATVAGIPVPTSPTGFGDVTVPPAIANPLTIMLVTSGIPVGSTVKVSMIPQYRAPILVDSPPTVGSLDNATTSVAMDIPFGQNVLSAQTSFMVVAAVGDALSRFAEGERVEKVTLTSTLGQGEKATLHTVAGKQFEVAPALLQLATLSR